MAKWYLSGLRRLWQEMHVTCPSSSFIPAARTASNDARSFSLPGVGYLIRIFVRSIGIIFYIIGHVHFRLAGMAGSAIRGVPFAINHTTVMIHRFGIRAAGRNGQDNKKNRNPRRKDHPPHRNPSPPGSNQSTSGASLTETRSYSTRLTL